MLSGPIVRPLVKFALPIAATSILQQLFNSADVAVVGKYAGSNALAAVGANAPVINLLINLFVGLSIGSNVVIAHLIGQNDKGEIHKAVHTSISLALISGFFLAIVGQIAARPIVSVLSTPPEIVDEAILYLRIYFAGMPFLMLYNFTSAIMRSCGDTKRPLIVLTISGVINVILNIIFVVGFGLSVDGVAIATVVATAFSAITLLIILSRSKSVVRFEIHSLMFDWRMTKRIASIGIPAGLQGVVFSFSNVLIQNAINSLGANAVAGATTALNFEYYTYFLANAFGQAATTFIGQNYGAGKIDRCRKIIKTCWAGGIISTSVMAVLIVFWAEPLCYLYSSDAIVISLAIIRIYMVTTFQFINSIIEVTSGILRALGYSIVPTIICVMGVCVVRIIWLYTAFEYQKTYEMLTAVYPFSWIITSISIVIAFVWIWKKKIVVAKKTLQR